MAVENIIGRLIVNVESDTTYCFEVAPQGDGQARFVDVELIKDNYTPYNVLTSDCLITLEGRNAGGYNVFVECTRQSANVLRVPLINGVLAVAGVGKYQIGVYDHGAHIHSFPFNVIVTEAPYDMDRLRKSDVYSALYMAIDKAMASNKWIVGRESPITSSVTGGEGDYYLQADNGSIWHYEKVEGSGLVWKKVLDSSGKQLTIMEHTYIRYSSNSSGNPMYDTPIDTSTTPPTTRDFIGFFITIDLPTASSVSDPSNYIWSPLRVNINNLTVQYAKSSSYTTHPTSGWTNTVPLVRGDNDEYLWTKITLHLNDGNSFTYYTVTQYGKSAGFGTPTSSIQDTAGKPIVSVTADPNSPNTARIFNFDFKIRGGHWKMGDLISGNGTRTVTALNSSNTVVGDMYVNGDVTSPSYRKSYRCTSVTNSNSTWEESIIFDSLGSRVYIRYSDSADSGPMYVDPIDTSTTPPTVRDYIGFFSTTDPDDAPSVSVRTNYQWSMLRMDVTGISTEYAKSNSYTTHPTSGWSSSIPSITTDEYLWTKITLLLKNGSGFSYYTVTQYGKPGGFGTPTSKISTTTGKPIVSVTTTDSSPNTAKVFNFDFKIRGGHWKSGTEITGNGTQTVTSLNDSNTVIGDIYINDKTAITYRCNAVTSTNSTWEEIKEIRGAIWRFGTVITGSGTVTSTAFNETNAIGGDVFVNTSTGIVYECTAVTASNSTWKQSYSFSNTITNITDLANTARFYKLLNPGEKTLTFHEADTIFSALDAKGNVYSYFIRILSSKPNIGPSQNYEAVITDGTIDLELTFPNSAARNMKVTDIPSGVNPSSEGWYEVDETSATGYSPTSDTSAVSGKNYYKPAQICLEAIKKNV